MATTKRIKAVRQLLTSNNLDALIVTHLPNIRWLCGYSGSNGICVVTQKKLFFFSDGRYKIQAVEEVEGFRVFITTGKLMDEIVKSKALTPKMTVGFEGQYVSVAQLKDLKFAFPKNTLKPTASLLERLIAVKDQREIDAIRAAVHLTDCVFDQVIRLIKPGVTELDIAAEIVYLHRKGGADADAFEPIVVSGARSAQCHARATSKKIETGEILTLDMGGCLNGYNSDLTRTVMIGKPSPEAVNIYNTVALAQMRAIEAAHAGMKTNELDAVARDIIKKHKYGKYFLHSLGHGLGMSVHETPLVSWKSSDPLLPGNVITIEPGIYIPNFGGVRIEDVIVIRERGCEVLTQSRKSLIVI
jgi:Xaa-Pro aminopeptidase